uniref:Alternative protein IGSF11 n=1 Tax=Homo sapiens TaxID=9606 RepID=L8E968_HUMAN|nr:alternative protein IGSF11 [Homo sapiens]
MPTTVDTGATIQKFIETQSQSATSVTWANLSLSTQAMPTYHPFMLMGPIWSRVNIRLW